MTQNILLNDLYQNLAYKFTEDKLKMFLNKETLVLNINDDFYIISHNNEGQPSYLITDTNGDSRGYYCSYQLIEFIENNIL